MRFKTLFALVVVGLAIAAPARAADQDDVAAVAKQWATAFAAHDADAVMALYSKAALLWGTTSPVLRTTPADVRGFFEGAFKIPNLQATFDNQTIRVFNNVAVVAGNYTFTASKGDQKQTSSARYSFTLVKDGGKWLIVDHNSSLMPQR